jgi:hypothetical protein
MEIDGDVFILNRFKYMQGGTGRFVCILQEAEQGYAKSVLRGELMFCSVIFVIVDWEIEIRFPLPITRGRNQWL